MCKFYVILNNVQPKLVPTGSYVQNVNIITYDLSSTEHFARRNLACGKVRDIFCSK